MGSWLCSQFCFTSFHFKKETVAQKLMYYCCERIWWNKNKSWHSISKIGYLFLSEKLRSFFVMISWCYNVLPKSLTRVLLVNTKAIENRVSGWQIRSPIKNIILKRRELPIYTPETPSQEKGSFSRNDINVNVNNIGVEVVRHEKRQKKKSSWDCSAIFKNHVLVTQL